MQAVSDSDWASEVESRKSTSCGVLIVGGAVQGAYSRGQGALALSSGEAEFYGAGSVANEGIGLCGIYAEMGIELPLILQLDSTAAIGMIQRRGTGRVRHMDVRHLHLQEMLRSGAVSALQKVPTSDNVADVGTKYFATDRLEALMEQLRMVTVKEERSGEHIAVLMSEAGREPANFANQLGELARAISVLCRRLA